VLENKIHGISIDNNVPVVFEKPVCMYALYVGIFALNHLNFWSKLEISTNHKFKKVFQDIFTSKQNPLKSVKIHIKLEFYTTIIIFI
jgi:hypothetical protein